VAGICRSVCQSLLAMAYFEMIEQRVKGRYPARSGAGCPGCYTQGAMEGSWPNMVLENAFLETSSGTVIFSELASVQEEQDKSHVTAPIGEIILLDPDNTTKGKTKA